MPITVQCPRCRGTLSAPDHLAGKRVQCPTCQGIVAVPEAAPPGDNPFADWNATARGDVSDAPELPVGWQTVRKGLQLISASMLTLFAVFLPMQCVVLEFIYYGFRGEMPGFMFAFVPVFAGAWVLYLVGVWMCRAVPKETGLTGKATSALVCSVLLGPVGTLPLLLFLRGVARYFKNRWVVKKITALALTVAVLLVDWGVDIVDHVSAATAPRRGDAGGGGLFQIISIIATMCALLLFSNIAFDTRKSIAKFRLNL